MRSKKEEEEEEVYYLFECLTHKASDSLGSFSIGERRVGERLPAVAQTKAATSGKSGLSTNFSP